MGWNWPRTLTLRHQVSAARARSCCVRALCLCCLQNEDAARKVFAAAVKAKAVTWHSYVAVAKMEYLKNNRMDIASKLFAKGKALDE